MTTSTLGFIGLGLMGTPIALKLCANGYSVRVWGRTQAKLEPALAAGAQQAQSPAELATACDILFLCVTDTQAVASVVFGDQGVVAGARTDTVLVDHSSIRPEETRRMAARLHAETGMHWIDAPVSGGATGVENKTLVVMAGAESSVFERVYPVVMSYAGRFTRMGDIGAGQSTKLINQALVGAGFALLAEVTQLAINAGIDVAKIPQALAGGRADSRLLQEYMPRMAQADFTPQGRIDIILKDLQTVSDVAHATHTAMPMTGLATELHRLLVATGHGSEDNAAFIKLLAKDKSSI